nr:4Fe-4S binding protein [Candidatus Njordarchaeota archaeon]
MSTKDSEGVYQKLRKHLDQFPIGFPSTKSGVEIRLLKYFFTPEEAEIATHLTMVPQTLQQIHKSLEKTGISINKLERILGEMAGKGSIYLARGREANYYFNAQLAIGMYEHQVNRLTKEFVADMRQYFDEAFGKEIFRTGSAQLRVIPVEKSITPDYKVAPYEDLKQFIANYEGPISVANCICRQANDLVGEPCKHTSLRESCFQFGGAARMYVAEKRGRFITKEQALEILRKAQDDGLVLEVLNAMKPTAICTCCEDCCGYLTNVKRLPRPAEFLPSSYYVQVDPDLCTGCETCVNVCPMGARTIRDNVSEVNTERCIGCGVCVPACPSDANKLIKKEKTVVPAKDVFAMYMQIMDNKLQMKKLTQHH